MNRTVFVSGGSRGIGRALVLGAARAGYDVAFTWRSSEAAADEVLAACAEAAPERRVRAYPLDVRDADATEAVAERVLDDLGSVWGVVCNAGVSRNGLAFSLSDQDWREVLDTNLTGAFHVARAFLPELIGARGGRILFLGSITAPGATGQVAYAASKAGLLGLCGTLAREVGRKGVTANVVVPGYFETDMTREQVSASNHEFAHRFGPSGRGGEMAELTSTVLFLLSDGAAYVNGAQVPVTGGLDWVP
ncbi:MAG: SDR family oxidoreductase [Alphaproteobacteria bacterium]|nr:SDR family oxidoreductase [Alphaproteobacteria bacterium]